MKLAILIPTIEGREHFLERLVDNCLRPQLDKFGDDVFIIVNKDQGYLNGGKTIGEKRNLLETEARLLGATHGVMIDDDDLVEPDYLELVMPAVYGDYDCASLIGVYYENGKRANKPDGTPKYFKHSIDYGEAVGDNAEYFWRPPNHLNVTKLEKLIPFKYEHKNFGEDMTRAVEVAKAGALKSEYKIEKPIYHYYSRTKVNGI